MSIMEQTEIDNKIQKAKKYDVNVRKYLALAVKALKRNLNVDIKITD